eukprot:tig00000852_g5047.t1
MSDSRSEVLRELVHKVAQIIVQSRGFTPEQGKRNKWFSLDLLEDQLVRETLEPLRASGLPINLDIRAVSSDLCFLLERWTFSFSEGGPAGLELATAYKRLIVTLRSIFGKVRQLARSSFD